MRPASAIELLSPGARAAAGERGGAKRVNPSLPPPGLPRGGEGGGGKGGGGEGGGGKGGGGEGSLPAGLRPRVTSAPLRDAHTHQSAAGLGLGFTQGAADAPQRLTPARSTPGPTEAHCGEGLPSGGDESVPGWKLTAAKQHAQVRGGGWRKAGQAPRRKERFVVAPEALAKSGSAVWSNTAPARC